MADMAMTVDQLQEQVKSLEMLAREQRATLRATTLQLAVWGGGAHWPGNPEWSGLAPKWGGLAPKWTRMPIKWCGLAPKWGGPVPKWGLPQMRPTRILAVFSRVLEW